MVGWWPGAFELPHFRRIRVSVHRAQAPDVLPRATLGVLCSPRGATCSALLRPSSKTTTHRYFGCASSTMPHRPTVPALCGRHAYARIVVPSSSTSWAVVQYAVLDVHIACW